MERIVVVGCGGSGKSVVARHLANYLGLPITHLDGLYYDEDWNPLPPGQFADVQRQLVARPRWVMDGNYASTLPIRLAAADTVLFLDLPAVACYVGIARRRLRYGGGQHPAEGVYDRVNASFLRYVASYRRTMRPRICALVAEHAPDAEFLAPTSRRQVDRLLDDICSTTTAPG